MSTVLNHPNDISTHLPVRGAEVADAIGHLMTASASIEEFRKYGETVSWTEVGREALRTLALRIYNHPQAHVLLFKILPINALLFEDFRAMAQDWANRDHHLTWEVMCKVEEVGQYICQRDEGVSLKNCIANGGTPCWYAVNNCYLMRGI